jgi:hypothetical protein
MDLSLSGSAPPNQLLPSQFSQDDLSLETTKRRSSTNIFNTSTLRNHNSRGPQRQFLAGQRGDPSPKQPQRPPKRTKKKPPSKSQDRRFKSLRLSTALEAPINFKTKVL